MRRQHLLRPNNDGTPASAVVSHFSLINIQNSAVVSSVPPVTGGHVLRERKRREINVCPCTDSVCTHTMPITLAKPALSSTPTVPRRAESVMTPPPIEHIPAVRRIASLPASKCPDENREDKEPIDNISNRLRDRSSSIVRTDPSPTWGEQAERALAEAERRNRNSSLPPSQSNESIVSDTSAIRTSARIRTRKESEERREEKEEIASLTTSTPVSRRKKRMESASPAESCGVKRKRGMKTLKLDNVKEEEENSESACELSDDDLPSTIVNPREEYSKEYYALLKSQLAERMSETAAERLVQFEKRANKKKKHAVETKLKSIVLGGRFEISTCYDNTYPEEYSRCERLWICDGCFAYYRSIEIWVSHARKCPLIYAPPGDEIYRDPEEKLSMFRVKGDDQTDYCTRLSQVVMLFLKDKAVYLDVEDFDFFVLTKFEPNGYRPVGYFSRQRLSTITNNLSCFCVFPCYQKKGYGRFIIDFSYFLSRISGIAGGPERPFSPLGLLSYTTYWKRTLLIALSDAPNHNEVTIEDLVRQTGMQAEDVQETLRNLFGAEENDANEYLISGNILHTLAAIEKARDYGRIYPKRECYEEQFVEYMRHFRSSLAAEEAIEDRLREKESEWREMRRALRG